jgi:methionyl-tRNA formyltransferase
MTGYPYATGNLLEQRNTYFYTRYDGQPFLAAWQQQRDAAKVAARGPEQPAMPAQPTDLMLEALWQALTTQQADVTLRQTLDRLLQRFEVTKRLHGEYNAAWRPVDPADYGCMERYLRFAEVLDMAWGQWSALPYLNALLKCLDTLTAMREQLGAAQVRRLALLIDREQAVVGELARSLGLAERHDDH